MRNEDIFSGQLNNALAQAVVRGTTCLENVPGLLKKVIKEGLAHWPGLESNHVDLSILCQKDPEALELLKEGWRKGSPALSEKVDLSEIGVEVRETIEAKGEE